MMDAHIVPACLKYKGSLSRHAGAWDVYCMMLHHGSIIFKGQDCSVGFQSGIHDPRFVAAAKVELEMLKNPMIPGIAKDPNWVILA